MYILPLNQIIPIKLFFIFLFLCLVSNVFALSTDGEKDIEIESDFAEIDDLAGVMIYSGKVKLTQGSMTITGETLTINFNDNDDVELAVVLGKPARTSQLPDDSEKHDRTESLKIEYYPLKETIILIDKVIVNKSDGSIINAAIIEYDTKLSKIKANSERTSLIKENNVEKQNKSRVKMIFKNKNSK